MIGLLEERSREERTCCSGFKLINHIPLGCARTPVSMILSWLRTKTLFLVKITLKPLSQNCATDTRARSVNSLNKDALQALGGSQGKSKTAVCVAHIYL